MFRAPLCPSSGAHDDRLDSFRLSTLDPPHEKTSRVTSFVPDNHPSCMHLTSNQQQLELGTVSYFLLHNTN